MTIHVFFSCGACTKKKQVEFLPYVTCATHALFDVLEVRRAPFGLRCLFCSIPTVAKRGFFFLFLMSFFVVSRVDTGINDGSGGLRYLACAQSELKKIDE